MRQRALIPIALFIHVLVFAEPSARAAEIRKSRFFLEGFIEGTLQPPHNEIDANLRRPDLMAETDGFGYAFARYSLRGQFFLGLRLGNRAVRNVFFALKPDFLFGNTIPRRNYTWSPAPIGYAKEYGLGVTLAWDVKVYLETHRWEFVGEHKLGLPGGGPKGLYTSIVIRKEFRFGDTY